MTRRLLSIRPRLKRGQFSWGGVASAPGDVGRHTAVETIRINGNGRVDMTVEFSADGEPELYPGLIPSAGDGWRVERSVEFGEDGSVEKHRLVASRTFGSDEPLPGTFAPDGELVIGPDPEVAGLTWLAGLGGRGMTIGPAAGELLAKWMDGDDDELFGFVTPERFRGGQIPTDSALSTFFNR